MPLLRTGTPADADAVTRIHLTSRAAAMPWLAVVHDDGETRWWVEHVVLTEQQVVLAEVAGVAVGFCATHEGWLEHLYVAPDAQGSGVGRALLAAAQHAEPAGLQLHVFTRNARARLFYEAAGFELVAESDGRDNEEREPDCTYRWTPLAVDA